MPKENADQTRCLCLVKMSSKSQCEIKTFLDKWNLRDFATVRPSPKKKKKILKRFLQVKEKEPHGKNTNLVRNREQQKVQMDLYLISINCTK